jgi:hypothetical protein
VENYSYGQIFPGVEAFACLGNRYDGVQQWQIVLTGLDFVNATRTVVGMNKEYKIGQYRNGMVIVNALVEGQNPPMLGEVVHLQAATGDFVKDVPLKNA